jgi:hypothetical protein
MTVEELRSKLHAMFGRLNEHGGSLSIDIENRTVGISVPKGSSHATIDKMVCDALDRLERMMEN